MMNETELREAMVRVCDLDDIDPASPLNTLAIIADYHDLDLVKVLEDLLRGRRFRFGPEAMIQDIIEASQSNPDRAMLSMRWMTILTDRFEDMA